MEIKKGDIVGRISYNKDILFYVSRIIKEKDKNAYAILKGITYRIEANAPLDDLEKIDKSKLESEQRGFENKIKKKIETASKWIFSKRNQGSNALILHLDGDKKYMQKSAQFYEKLHLRAVVKNIPENRQPQLVRLSY